MRLIGRFIDPATYYMKVHRRLKSSSGVSPTPRVKVRGPLVESSDMIFPSAEESALLYDLAVAVAGTHEVQKLELGNITLIVHKKRFWNGSWILFVNMRNNRGLRYLEHRTMIKRMNREVRIGQIERELWQLVARFSYRSPGRGSN